MRDLRIVFMGTPEFAVASLEALVAAGQNIVAVVTAPDREQGRGRKVMPSPVKASAVAHDIPVLQPTNLKSPEFLEELKSFEANLQVVVAFRMLPEVVWSMPKYGTFNLHASLLPQYRGAAPINWAIINGEKTTGVTTFFLKHEIDTGNIIMQEEEPISSDDNVGDLYERLMHKGAKLVVQTVAAIANDEVEPQPQKAAAELKSAPKIFKETCRINWAQNTSRVRDFIRGLSPYPAAWTEFDGTTCKIFEAELFEKNKSGSPGDISTDQKTYLAIACADGWLKITNLQKQGKKRLPIDEFLRGNKIESTKINDI